MEKDKIQDRLKEARETLLSPTGIIVIVITILLAVIGCSVFNICHK